MYKPKTRIMVEFAVLGDDFDPQVITKELNLLLTEQRKKGDQKAIWSTSIKDENAERFKKTLRLFSENKEKLLHIRKEHDLEFKFMIDLLVTGENEPALILFGDVLQLAKKLEAKVEFHMNVYANCRCEDVENEDG